MDARKKVIEEATNGESIVGRKELDDIIQSSKFDGTDRELVASLHLLSMNGGGEGFAGSVDYGSHGTLMFPYILTEDSQGFCDVLGPFDDMADAEKAMSEIEPVESE